VIRLVFQRPRPRKGHYAPSPLRVICDLTKEIVLQDRVDTPETLAMKRAFAAIVFCASWLPSFGLWLPSSSGAEAQASRRPTAAAQPPPASWPTSYHPQGFRCTYLIPPTLTRSEAAVEIEVGTFPSESADDPARCVLPSRREVIEGPQAPSRTWVTSVRNLDIAKSTTCLTDNAGTLFSTFIDSPSYHQGAQEYLGPSCVRPGDGALG